MYLLSRLEDNYIPNAFEKLSDIFAYQVDMEAFAAAPLKIAPVVQRKPSGLRRLQVEPITIEE